MPSRLHALLLTLAILLTAHVALGQNGGEPPAPPASVAPDRAVIPDSVPGHRLRWVLGVLNDQADFAWKANFSLAFQRSVNEQSFKRNIDRLRTLSGGWDIVAVRSASFEDITALLRMRSSGAAWQLEVRVEPVEPRRIDGLRLLPAIEGDAPELDSWDAVREALESLQADASMSVFELEPDGTARRIFAHEGAARRAIGMVSGFYLAACLNELVLDGEAVWHLPVLVVDELKSIPAGRTWATPSGTPMTLAELLRSLFSQGDCSAFDHLLHFVGRERLEEWLRGVVTSPEGMTPFLSTREFALLKYPPDESLRERYASEADPEVRRSILEGELPGRTLPSREESAWIAPRSVGEIGWFASTDDTCAVVARLLAHSDVPTIDLLDAAPTVPFDRITWPTIAFQAGAEPGVLSATMLVTRADLRRFAVAFAVNDDSQPIDGAATHPILMSTMALLGDLP